MGGIAPGGNIYGYNAHWTWTCFFCCLSASAGGALFGYDNGRSMLPPTFLLMRRSQAAEVLCLLQASWEVTLDNRSPLVQLSNMV